MTRFSRIVPSSVIALTLALAACHRPASTTQLTSGPVVVSSRPADADIARAVARHFHADATLRTEPLHAVVEDGICTLTGTADNVLAKERALRVVETLKGVRAVVDRVDVEPVERTDAQLEKDVRRALNEDRVTRGMRVQIDANNQLVRLAGDVPSWPARTCVEDLVKSVKGVRGVDDQLSVKYATPPTDADVATAVRERIRNDVWLDGNTVSVAAHGGDVHLNATLPSASAKERAASDAWLPGVTAVDDSGLVVDASIPDDRRDTTKLTDVQIASAVRDAFRIDPRLQLLEPEVTVLDGVVRLSGTVDDANARRAAELDARDAVGVVDVRDDAVVLPARHPTDADIDRDVKRALARDTFLPNPSGIDVSSAKGKVVLSGKLDDGFERAAAVADAAKVPGVVEVDDEIRIGRAPSEIKMALDDRLGWDAAVRRGDVTASVAPDGVVTLAGTADDWAEVRAAVDDAEFAGAARVLNLLKVRHP